MITVFSQAAIYQSTDSKGNIIFSDRYSPNSVLISLPTINLTPAADADLAKIENTTSTDNQITISTPSIEIITPANEQHFNNPDQIKIEVKVTPLLRKGENIGLFIDNELLQPPSSNTEFVLKNLVRGEHDIYAELLAANGQIIATSNPIKIYLHFTTMESNTN